MCPCCCSFRAYTFLWITFDPGCRLRLALGSGLIGLSVRDWVSFFSVVVRPKWAHEGRFDPERVAPVYTVWFEPVRVVGWEGRSAQSAHLAICGYRRFDPVGVIIVETRQWHVSTVNANVKPLSLVMTDLED